MGNCYIYHALARLARPERNADDFTMNAQDYKNLQSMGISGIYTDLGMHDSELKKLVNDYCTKKYSSYASTIMQARGVGIKQANELANNAGIHKGDIVFLFTSDNDYLAYLDPEKNPTIKEKIKTYDWPTPEQHAKRLEEMVTQIQKNGGKVVLVGSNPPGENAYVYRLRNEEKIKLNLTPNDWQRMDNNIRKIAEKTGAYYADIPDDFNKYRADGDGLHYSQQGYRAILRTVVESALDHYKVTGTQLQTRLQEEYYKSAMNILKNNEFRLPNTIESASDLAVNKPSFFGSSVKQIS